MVRIILSVDTTIVGVYISPVMSVSNVTKTLQEKYSHSNPDTLFVVEINERIEVWDRLNNDKGKALINFAHRYNLIINPLCTPSFR